MMVLAVKLKSIDIVSLEYNTRLHYFVLETVTHRLIEEHVVTLSTLFVRHSKIKAYVLSFYQHDKMLATYSTNNDTIVYTIYTNI